MGAQKGAREAVVQRVELVTERRRRFSDEQKLRILSEAECEGESLASVARRHGIARSLLQTWKKRFMDDFSRSAVPALPPATAVGTEGFIRIVPQEEEATTGEESGSVLVHVNAEVIVEAGPGVSANRLAAVVAALRSASSCGH
jgi:transposase